jgi:hypothetical protein
MAYSFTSAQTIAIAQYLGLPVTEDNQALIDDTSTLIASDGGPLVIAVLTSLSSLDLQIATARNTGSPQPYQQLKLEGSRLVQQLSAAMGIELRRDIYD